MNKPTKEEMSIDRMLKWLITTKAHAVALFDNEGLTYRLEDEATFNAVYALILASPEAGEQRERKPAPDPHSLEMLKETGIYFAPPNPAPAPLPAEVEAAMVTLRECADFCRVSQRSCAAGGRSNDALSTIRAALTEARQPKVVSRDSGHVSPTGGKQQESEMTTEEPK